MMWRGACIELGICFMGIGGSEGEQCAGSRSTQIVCPVLSCPIASTAVAVALQCTESNP
jgi:hypothetical protein